MEGVEFRKSDTCLLDSYKTEEFTQYFYFPATGTFKMQPGNISRNGKIFKIAERMGVITVRQSYTVKKLESFEDVIVNGTKQEILQYLKKTNLRDTAKF